MNTETLHARAERLVQNEVLCCVSSLVSTLAQNYFYAIDNDGELPSLIEQAFELASPVPDYEEAAREAGWTIGTFGRDKVRKWLNPLKDDGSRYCDKPSSIRALCEDHDIDPYDREVFEHWAVSEWLADKLIEKGEKVDKDFANLNVWARTTTGQAISIDWVIEQITQELHAATPWLTGAALDAATDPNV